MITRALRLLLFRFLPRRLAPILLVWEGFQLFRRLRSGRRRPDPVPPRRLRTVGEYGHEATPTRRRAGRSRTAETDERSLTGTRGH